MEGRNKIDFLDIIAMQENKRVRENYEKIELIQTNQIINLNQGNSKIINLILIEIILIILIKGNLSIEQHYIDIKVNEEGNNQILSDKYEGAPPSKILINGNDVSINKNVNVRSKDYTIRLIFQGYISQFSFMFSNLKTITYVNMYHMFGNDCNMSYMFYNCFNLTTFQYTSDYRLSNNIIDMRYMFYNCALLNSFLFQNLYMDYYENERKSKTVKNETTYYYIKHYNYINLSYMFYNCNNLVLISFDSHSIKFISDMKYMFYNCFSLTSLNLEKIKTNNYIDLSYMFYNCSSLKNFQNEGFHTKDMKHMFYNCSSLINININDFYVSCCYERDDLPCSSCPSPSHYLINMAGLFYNCYNLLSVEGSFEHFYISDTKEMFYNCISLKSLKFNPKSIKIHANMAKMFYNCKNIKDITLISSNEYVPNDLQSAFYNCISLISLKINDLKTDYVEDISYMLFNCKMLSSLSLINCNFTNLLITNMKGIFQNCESLISINLTTFKTPEVKIMWDMFKNCKSLSSLDLSNFDTSKVTDMESMFEGCERLISLSLVNFETSNVRYMNKMFRGCKRLQSLYFNNITSESLGTMQQMFYDCGSLKYLNIYSLTEKEQSISEMFDGASNDFTLCIKENENIPNIFEEFYKRSNTKRDCSDACYGAGNARPKITEKKICCRMFEYNGICYDKCPKRMNASLEDKFCKFFNCSPKYYNYEQDDCIDDIPDGYYESNQTLKTIDKCHKTCKTCNTGPTGTKANCVSCNGTYPYFYFNNCLASCENDYYNKSGFLECRCITKECSDCTEDSLRNGGSCVSCNEGYYPKFSRNPSSYKKCYKDPPKYYFDNDTNCYKPCYSSCQKCYGDGNEEFHNCSICDANKTFEIIKNENGYEGINCYENCTYYYYFYDNIHYNCTEADECPQNFNYLIVDLGECVHSCDETLGYNKNLKKECYKECPPGISIQNGNNSNICISLCSYDKPFKLIEEDKCVASCSIMERSTKLCITSYFENRTNLEIQEIIHVDILLDLLDKFNYKIITENETVLIEENKTIYEIITTRNNNPNSNTTIINLGECETRLKEYYEIDKDAYLYMLVIDAYLEGKTGPFTLYEVFYPLLNSPTLFQLDLSICEGLQINMLYNLELENPELYDKNNPIYNDICCPYSSKEGVDMVVADVQREYIDNNKSICGEDCIYGDYNNGKVQCDCKIQLTLPPLSEIKIDKDKLYKFSNIKNVANFGVLKCFNLLTIKERMIPNIGIYSFIPTLIAYIVCLIVFSRVDFKDIKEKIKELLYAKLNLKYTKKKKEQKQEPNKSKIQEPEQIEENSNEPIIKYKRNKRN